MNKKIKYLLIVLGFLSLITLLYNKPVSAAPQSDYIYNIYNKASGKCLNVNYGTDANGTKTTNGTGNGSGAGTSSTATGNVYVSTYTGSDYQLWSFRETNAFNYYYNGSSLGTDIMNNYAVWVENYVPKTGYRYIPKLNQNTNNFLNDLKNSEIFLYSGHGLSGEGGALLGNDSSSSEYVFGKNAFDR